MEQGDGYCDDVCRCQACQEPTVPGDASFVDLLELAQRQRAAIEDFLHLAGYLPEAYQVLTKHGLR